MTNRHKMTTNRESGCLDPCEPGEKQNWVLKKVSRNSVCFLLNCHKKVLHDFTVSANLIVTTDTDIISLKKKKILF